MIHSNRNSRAADICQTPCLKLTGRRCWRYPENTRISRGWQSGSCVLGVGASSSNHPPLRPACDHDSATGASASGEGRGRDGAAETDGRRGKGGGPAWQPRRPAPVSPSATEPAPTSAPRISRHPHRARDEPNGERISTNHLSAGALITELNPLERLPPRHPLERRRATAPPLAVAPGKMRRSRAKL